jgi:hypothetical protein
MRWPTWNNKKKKSCQNNYLTSKKTIEDFIFLNKYKILFCLNTMATKPVITVGRMQDPIMQPSVEIRDATEYDN